MSIPNFAGNGQHSMPCIRKPDPVIALNEAIQVAGGIIAFSRALGLSHQVVYEWKKQGYVPTERALIIQHLYGVPYVKLVKPALAELLAAPSAADLI